MDTNGGDGLEFRSEDFQVSRAELQQFARDRIEDARILLANGRWQAAYYLVGYAVECGLKPSVPI